MPKNTAFVRWDDFRLVLRMKGPMATAERGHMLLNLEKRFRREIHSDIEVFLEPRGDLNQLRAETRGVMR